MTPLFTLPGNLDASASLDAQEAQTLAYIARVPTDGEHPEVPCIGSNGPRSKALTKNIIFQLYLTGKLKRTNRRGIVRWWNEKKELFARRWATFCAEEPPLQRHHRPSLFPPFDPTPISDFDHR